MSSSALQILISVVVSDNAGMDRCPSSAKFEQQDHITPYCTWCSISLLIPFLSLLISGTGECEGATVELALNYVADLTAKKQGGMFRIADVPYSSSTETWLTCDDVTLGKDPAVGIRGWTKLPSNDYKTTMNAVAKVRPIVGGCHFSINRILCSSFAIVITATSFSGWTSGHSRKCWQLGIL